ncbi:cyclase family protein [Halioxenophilus aromaticivorans]|uniref:Cyclase family protein n=1 Tax=Halioxenophilus aromaticivorans TaxID=1306992 RepID=A0AAV3TY50_9ALTE
MSATQVLSQLASFMSTGGIKVVDLTRTLDADTPILQLPEEMGWGKSKPFQKEEISRYNELGPFWYWNNFECGEHTGTHFDAPVHWVTGKDYGNNTTDTLPVEQFIAPCVVIDAVEESKANADFLVDVDFLKRWEVANGPIPSRAWVLYRTDWSKKESEKEYLNVSDDGGHTPGWSPGAVKFLVSERDVIGVGVETVGTDAGQAPMQDPMFPCHNVMHGANKCGLASLCNLDQLPATGALIIAAPLKIKEGSGSPLRVLALVPTT